MRALYRDAPVSFYERLALNDDLREALGLKYLDALDGYEEYNRKRKKLKHHSRKISKRNLKTDGGEISFWIQS
ncbi:hypothetical protein AKJ43_01070 [candidate division MSBL1 archaeon SCGC-AAA261D19]|uniref:Uncharacterized protein n=2 Tax=candidate division MSBL1 TaxID=215777 RepID=A0A133V894_9EURY|nr:hypothetical protein AKJ43_01070 [candidate division MSBL1 archaeon SCGC-AAA261D19]